MDRETLLRLLESQRQNNEDYDQETDTAQSNESEADIIDNPSADIEAKKAAIQLVKEKYLGK